MWRAASARREGRGTDKSGEAGAARTRRLHGAAAIVAAWLLVGTFNLSGDYLAAHYGGDLPEPREMIVHLYDVLLWAALTPLVFALVRRFPLERRAWCRSLAVHAGSAVLVAVACAALNYPLLRLVFPGRDVSLPAYTARIFHFNVQWYCILVGVGHALAYYQRLRDRELAASRLEAQLARAQLEALKMQMHPHFLFNTLNAICELVHEDVRLAERTILRLARLLRLTVDSAATQEVTVRQELAFLGAYLSIQQTRFRDRLTVEVEVEPGTERALVPAFVLQPLVENALRHGFSPDDERQWVKVSARRDDGWLRLAVEDSGKGFPTPREMRIGVGVGNTRARLRQMYGDAHRFELRNRPKGGACVAVILPLREGEEPDAVEAAEAEGKRLMETGEPAGDPRNGWEDERAAFAGR